MNLVFGKLKLKMELLKNLRFHWTAFITKAYSTPFFASFIAATINASFTIAKRSASGTIIALFIVQVIIFAVIVKVIDNFLRTLLITIVKTCANDTQHENAHCHVLLIFAHFSHFDLRRFFARFEDDQTFG